MTELELQFLDAPPRRISTAAMEELPGQVADVSQVVAGRRGQAVPLRSVVDHVAAGAIPDDAHVTLCSADGFRASVPLEPVLDGLIVYRDGDRALAPEHGGPLRFLLPGVESCGTGEVDRCANVKQLAAITITRERGPDDRP